MKTLLLDTNIVIYLSQNIQYAQLYRPLIAHARCVISFITVAELYEGAFRAGYGSRKFAKIEREIEKYMVIPYSIQICKKFGEIRAARKNRPISVPDALVAATAMTYNLSLVTHNRIDFDEISPELKTVSKYQPPA